MQDREGFRADLRRSALAYDAGSKSPPKFVDALLRRARGPGGADALVREVEVIPLRDAPRGQHRPRNDDPEGVADLSQGELHDEVITLL